MNLEEFNYQFGVNGAENLIRKLNQIESETEELDQAVSHLGNTFQQFFDIALRSSIPPAFIKMVMDQARSFSKQAEYIDRLSQVSGISSRTIQQFGYALHRFGGDVTTAASQLDHLQTKLEKFQKPIAKGGGLASELARLSKKHKVNLKGVTSSVDLLKAIAERMEKLSDRKKVELAKAFGLDDSTFLMVKQGLKSVEEAMYKAQKFILFDDKEIKQAKEFENTMRDIADNITLISKSFSFGAIPEMQKFANIARAVTDYMSEHKEIVKGIGMTAFGAGAYGIFRLLNLVPTKFLKGAAGVFGTGWAIGAINEDLDKWNRGKRDLSIIGWLQDKGWTKTSKYVEAIFRAIHDLTQNKSFQGFKDLFGLAANDFSESVGEFKKSVTAFGERVGEYYDAFNADGIKGVLALMMTPKKGTDEERSKAYDENLKKIDAEGGVTKFLWKEAKETYQEIKKTLTSKEFWTPIFDKINSVFDYLKGMFYDLVIFIKQQFGMELSTSEKAHIIKKRLTSKEKEAADREIQAAAALITKTMLEAKTPSEVKDKTQQQLYELSSQIYKDYGNSGYSREGITARLAFAGAKGFFKAKYPNATSTSDEISNLFKTLGMDFVATKDEIVQLFNEYTNKKKKKTAASKGNLKASTDVSDILSGVEGLKGVDLKNLSFEDFIKMATTAKGVSQAQIDKALLRYKGILPEDALGTTLELAMESSEALQEYSQPFTDRMKSLGTSWWDSLTALERTNKDGKTEQTWLGRVNSWIQEKGANLKHGLYERIKKIDPENEILKKQEKDLKIQEVLVAAIYAEIEDVHRNWVSIDQSIEAIGGILKETQEILKNANVIIKKFVTEISAILSGYAAGKIGSIIGAALGFAVAGVPGAQAGGAIGAALAGGGTYAKIKAEMTKALMSDEEKVATNAEYVKDIDTLNKSTATIKEKGAAAYRVLKNDVYLGVVDEDLKEKFRMLGTARAFLEQALNNREFMPVLEQKAKIESLKSKRDNSDTDAAYNAFDELVKKAEAELPEIEEKAKKEHTGKVSNVANLQKLIEKLEADIEKARIGQLNLEKVAQEAMAANTNREVANKNDIKVYQNIEVQGDGISTKEDVKKGAREGALQGINESSLRGATTNSASGVAA